MTTIARAFWMLLALACCAAPAAAESAGQNVWDLGVGLGVPLSGLDLTRFGGGGERPGGAGIAFSPQYLRQLSSSFGAGAEVAYMNFPAKSVGLPAGGGSSSGDLFAVELVGRYLFDPDAGFSPYLTAGAGVGRYAVTVQQNGGNILDAATTGWTAFPGIGVKADLGQVFEASGELRWQLGSASRTDFGTSLYNVFAFFVRLGWRG